MLLTELFKLDELVNAPDQEVYHWTDAKSLFKMWRMNVIKGETVHELNDKTYQGVSLTRNKLFDIQHTYAIGGIKAWRIGINLRKLKADYKVFPIRYEPYRSLPRQKQGRQGIMFGGNLGGFAPQSSDEMEEFCVGDIYPLWHYMSSLAVEMRNVSLDTHPSEMKRWAEEDFEDGDDSFGSAYSRDDQNLLFDLMVGTYYGQGPYQEVWAKYGAKRRKSALRLPDNFPFYLIDREKNQSIPFKQAAMAELERYSLGFPEQPDNTEMSELGDEHDGRGDRNSEFNQSTHRYRLRDY